MGQRHNRRRTRPRSRNRQGTPVITVNPATSSPLAIPSSIWSSNNSYLPPASTAACISLGSPVPTPLAPTWHYGYTASRIRESSLQQEDGGFETQQCRLFGGEPGDDVSLCFRMLEYFGGLDYIDSARDNSPGD